MNPIPFYPQQHKTEWVIFYVSAIALMLLYRVNIEDLIKKLVEWIFVGMGFTLLVEYNLKEKSIWKQDANH